MKSTFLLFSIFLMAICIFPAAGNTEEINPAQTDAGNALQAAPEAPLEAEPDRNRDGHEEFQTLDSLFGLYQPYLENISAYEPLYFLVGADPEETRFQFSFKYRFLNPETEMVKKYSWIQGFHLAYTQTSFWDLSSESQPFKDTSYKPELFFQSPSIFDGSFGISRLFVQTGYQHESNGRGEDLSRSTNFLYFEPIFIFYHEPTQLGFLIAPKIWTYVRNDDETNPDLYRYRGYFDLEIKAGRAQGLVFESHLRSAKEGTSLRLDLTYPLDELLSTPVDVYLQVQYVNMLAESLLNYTRRNRALRLGIAIVR